VFDECHYRILQLPGVFPVFYKDGVTHGEELNFLHVADLTARCSTQKMQTENKENT